MLDARIGALATARDSPDEGGVDKVCSTRPGEWSEISVVRLQVFVPQAADGRLSKRCLGQAKPCQQASRMMNRHACDSQRWVSPLPASEPMRSGGVIWRRGEVGQVSGCCAPSAGTEQARAEGACAAGQAAAAHQPADHRQRVLQAHDAGDEQLRQWRGMDPLERGLPNDGGYTTAAAGRLQHQPHQRTASLSSLPKKVEGLRSLPPPPNGHWGCRKGIWRRPSLRPGLHTRLKYQLLQARAPRRLRTVQRKP